MRHLESQSTTKVNWPRVFGCGTFAGIVWIVLVSIVTALLGRDFAALPHNRLDDDGRLVSLKPG
jgi:hypothetical protein